MPHTLGDVYIGSFPMIQPYGARPEVYSARYNLRGHPGIDIACPSLTMILSTAHGRVLETGFDAGGDGNFVEILHDGFVSRYAHLNDYIVKKDDMVVAGQLIGHSNNTGFSDTPHLCFKVALVNEHGEKQTDNGYGGYIDPMGIDFVWEVKNLTEPIVPSTEITPPIPVAPEELSLKTTQANNFLTIVAFLQNQGVQGLDVNDPKCGENVNAYIAGLLEDNTRPQTLDEQPLPVVEKPRKKLKLPNIKRIISRFIFIQKEEVR